ncbi:MAG: EAL domain-containing protein [Pseudomonadota bacterium]
MLASTYKKKQLAVRAALAAAGLLALITVYVSASSFSSINATQTQLAAAQATLLQRAALTVQAFQSYREAVRGFGHGDAAIKRDDLREALEALGLQLSLLTSGETQSLLRTAERTASAAAGSDHTRQLVELLHTIYETSASVMPEALRTINGLTVGSVSQATRAIERSAALDRQVNTFQVLLFKRNLHVQNVFPIAADRMSTRFFLACFVLVLGLIAAGALFTVYVQQSRRMARLLRQSNARLLRKVEETEHLASTLGHHARHDELTGLLNRTGFNGVLDGVLSDGKGRHGLCFIDLDLFKIVNDTSGHAAGDHLLQRVASVLSSHLPKRGYAIRLGGDEFLLFAPFTTEVKFRETVQSCVDELNPLRIEYDGQHFEVTASFGATFFNAEEHTVDTVLSIVDTACYEAKNAGGGRVYFHSGKEGVVESRQSEMQWVAKIRESLENRRMQLHYQNIVETTSIEPKVHSMEILVRMLDDGGNVVSPGSFLDIAERFSLATRIDKFVINETFEWLRAGNLNTSQNSLININLSGRSIGDNEVLRYIEELCGKLNTPSDRVCFEITETAAVGKNARDFLVQLHELGFKLALDDFGSGFSSFGYLESLPVDYIKIDGMFVQDLDTNTTHREFITAINRVGKAMGKLTVAEFVENQASLELLEQIGVDFAQGYHLHKPVELAKRPLVLSFAEFQEAA